MFEDNADLNPSERHERANILRAGALIALGSLGIQSSSALSVTLFHSYGSAATSSVRMLLAAVVLITLIRPRLRSRSGGEWAGIAVYGLAMAAMNLCLYLAIERLPLGVAVTLDFLGPCCVALAASRHLREGACALVAAGGVALISLGPGGYFDALGFAAGLGAAFFFGVYTLFAVRVGRVGTGLDGLALSVLVGALLTGPIAIPVIPAVRPDDWLCLLAAAAIGVVVPYSVDTVAARATSARVIGTLFAIDPAMGALIGRVLLHQELTPTAICGVALVAASGALLVSLAEAVPPTNPPDEPDSNGTP